jgi:tetratricopeptide (TPR) repeat protein
MMSFPMYSAFRTLTARTFVFSGLLALLLGLLGSPRAASAQSDSGDAQVSQQQKGMHYSLYYENFKNENFASARKDLKWILNHAPGFPAGDDRNYERAVELYSGLAASASGEKQMAYLDTAMTYLTTAQPKMDEAGLDYSEYAWEIEKGRFLQQHGDKIDEKPDGLESHIAHYRNAFDLKPKEINPYYINQVMKGLMEEGDQEAVLAFADKVETNRGDDAEAMKIVDRTRNKIFGRNPQARINYLESQMEKNPEDAEVMASLFDALVQQGNIQRASKVAEKLMKTDPPADIVRQVAKMRLDNGRPKAAFQTYQQAEEAGASLSAQDYYNMGTAQQRMGNLSKARTFYRKALDEKSDFGRAYIAIGDLYAKAVSQCGGSKMARNDKAVYWLAVDMYQKAKQVDSSIASTANNKIQTYRKYFPNQEDIFYRDDWEAGQSFTINYGCYSWINKTTTVRQAS